jgi:hypothetical protein
MNRAGRSKPPLDSRARIQASESHQPGPVRCPLCEQEMTPTTECFTCDDVLALWRASGWSLTADVLGSPVGDSWTHLYWCCPCRFGWWFPQWIARPELYDVVQTGLSY